MSRRWLWLLAVGVALGGLAVGTYSPEGWWAWSWIGYPVAGGVVVWRQPVAGATLLAAAAFNPLRRRVISSPW